ncbi:DUF6462 family protein [Butyrivibrio sp.]|uniref:DUF6462 family protein n=1 Tax=Butyrivibrio sp. TaxID=28121 RepID=UPI002ED0D394
MHRTKSPPVNLDKYLEGKEHHYCSYEAGARKYGMAYWTFVRLCQEIGANIPLRKTALVDMDIVDKYIEENCGMESEKGEGEDMPRARKPVENLEELIREGKKKYVRMAEGAELYSVGIHTFEIWARDAKARRKVKGVVLVNTEKIDAFLETFEEEDY